jgi:crotonobetainyl-CoA:carnitine CoA-transferase CaiB-like acyl-CoA transferase
VASIVPYQAFEAKDGYLILAIGNDSQWKRFCEAAGRGDLGEDDRFTTNPNRVTHREALVPMLELLLRERTVADWVTLCNRADVPAGPVNTIDKVFSDTQLQARNMVIHLERVDGTFVPMVGSPLNLSQTPVAMLLPPPRLGEHTDEILRDMLSLEEEEIADYKNNAVI